ncbi:MAG: bifunctional riboflavin kinase/FAD synthetase [Dehalococcoidales bacterium]
MPIEEELAGLSPEREMLLTIGVFDGVHLGHKHLISELQKRAREQNLLSGVVTFRQHPAEVLSPYSGLPYLTSLSEKVSLLKDEGVDAVVVLTFSGEIARLGARQFVGLLKKHLKMRGLVIGPDFALGRNREGNVDTLRKLGEELGFSVTEISPVRVNGGVASSTAIREALADGNIKKVNSLIGRPFSLQGKVTTGLGRGQKLGFPTANLEIDPGQALPTDGVYATWAYSGGETYRSMTNIGTSPTFDDRGRTVETYLLGYRGDLYGRELKIDFVERLRGEKKFDTVEELKKQMTQDIKQGEAILDSRGGR